MEMEIEKGPAVSVPDDNNLQFVPPPDADRGPVPGSTSPSVVHTGVVNISDEEIERQRKLDEEDK